MKGALEVVNTISVRQERDVTCLVGNIIIRGDVCILASSELRTFFFRHFATFLVVEAAEWSDLLDHVARQRLLEL